MSRIIYIVYIVYVGLYFIEALSAHITVRTYPDYLHVSWSLVPSTPTQWTLTYKVLGSGYHSVLKVPGNSSSANISTVDYPGLLYMISLYVSTGGNDVRLGTVYGRSDCSKHINTTIGESYSFESFHYHGIIRNSAICTWSFAGSNTTWYKFGMEDFQTSESCSSYIEVGHKKICGNETVNGTIFIYEPSFVVKTAFIPSDVFTRMKFRIAAIHKVTEPLEVTVNSTDNVISVKWNTPFYQPVNLSYTLRISHYPFNSYIDLTLLGNMTNYTYHVTSHVGQKFSVQMQSVSENLSSNFTDPIFVSTSCDNDVFIKATENTAIVSEQYPHGYLPDVTCHFRLQTEEGFYLLLLTHDLDIGRGQMCDKAYIEVENEGRFCHDTPLPPKLVIQDSSVVLVYKSDEDVLGKGFNMTIVSVAVPPPAPQNVMTTSDGTSLYVSWEPPSSRESYIKGYSVQYFIAPHTPGATLSVDKDVHNVTIDTLSHPGRLYAMRIAGFTDGGMGNYSHPFYVRAGCGKNYRIARRESIMIGLPLHESGFYGPDTLCKWTVQTHQPLGMKITMKKLSLEDSPNCTKDYIDVSGAGRFCGEHNTSVVVVMQTEVVITFRSDNDNEAKGFTFHIEAVGPTPTSPTGVSVSQSSFGIVIQWSPPASFQQFVTGYLIHYQFFVENKDEICKVGPNANYHVLDMTSFPGRLLEIWIQAEGDVESSNGSKSVYIRSECGKMINLSRKVYISSPYHEDSKYSNIQCIWTVIIQENFHAKVDLIGLNLNNKINSCENFLNLHNISRFCDDSIEGKSILLNSTKVITLEFHIGPSARGSNFLVSMEPIKPEPVPLTLPESNSSALTSPSSAVLISSYVGTLVASTLMASTMFSMLHDLETEDSLGETASLQSSMPRHDDAKHTEGYSIQTDTHPPSTETVITDLTVTRADTSTTFDIWKTSSHFNLKPSDPDIKSSLEISPTKASSHSFTSDISEISSSVIITNSLYTGFPNSQHTHSSELSQSIQSELMKSVLHGYQTLMPTASLDMTMLASETNILVSSEGRWLKQSQTIDSSLVLASSDTSRVPLNSSILSSEVSGITSRDIPNTEETKVNSEHNQMNGASPTMDNFYVTIVFAIWLNCHLHVIVQDIR